MLIDTAQKENDIAFQPMITRDNIRKDLLVRMADVGRRVGVVDGGGEEEWTQRFWFLCLFGRS
jgi:hypothetical protein